MVTASGRPTPIREAARLWSLAVGGIGAVVSFALTSNVLSADQATAVTSVSTAVDVLMAALVALVTAGSTVLAAFRTAATSEPKVTPLVSPRDDQDRALTPEGTDPVVA